MYAFSTSIISVSNAVAAQFHPYIRRRRVQVLHNGFPRDEFAPVGDDRISAFRNAYHLRAPQLVGSRLSRSYPLSRFFDEGLFRTLSPTEHRPQAKNYRKGRLLRNAHRRG